jgi:hypothetical protein
MPRILFICTLHKQYAMHHYYGEQFGKIYLPVFQMHMPFKAACLQMGKICSHMREILLCSSLLSVELFVIGKNLSNLGHKIIMHSLIIIKIQIYLISYIMAQLHSEVLCIFKRKWERYMKEYILVCTYTLCVYIYIYIYINMKGKFIAMCVERHHGRHICVRLYYFTKYLSKIHNL